MAKLGPVELNILNILGLLFIFSLIILMLAIGPQESIMDIRGQLYHTCSYEDNLCSFDISYSGVELSGLRYYPHYDIGGTDFHINITSEECDKINGIWSEDYNYCLIHELLKSQMRNIVYRQQTFIPFNPEISMDDGLYQGVMDITENYILVGNNDVVSAENWVVNFDIPIYNETEEPPITNITCWKQPTVIQQFILGEDECESVVIENDTCGELYNSKDECEEGFDLPDNNTNDKIEDNKTCWIPDANLTTCSEIIYVEEQDNCMNEKECKESIAISDNVDQTYRKLYILGGIGGIILLLIGGIWFFIKKK